MQSRLRYVMNGLITDAKKQNIEPSNPKDEYICIKARMMQQPILSFLFSAPSDRCHQVRFCILSFANKQWRHTNTKELGVWLHCQQGFVSFIEHNKNVGMYAFSSIPLCWFRVFGIKWIPCKQDNIKSYNC